MFKKNCKKRRFVTNLHITLVRSTILEDTPVTRHPKSASSKLTDMLLTQVRMRFLEKSTFLQDLTQTHPWAANTHETNEIIRILMEKGCPTAPQAGGLPSKNDPKTLEVLQKWIFEENAWCIQRQNSHCRIRILYNRRYDKRGFRSGAHRLTEPRIAFFEKSYVLCKEFEGGGTPQGDQH